MPTSSRSRDVDVLWFEALGMKRYSSDVGPVEHQLFLESSWKIAKSTCRIVLQDGFRGSSSDLGLKIAQGLADLGCMTEILRPGEGVLSA